MTATAIHSMRSRSEAQTSAIGAALGRLLVGGELVALRGELGAGKTCLVRGLAEGLGIDPESISSPTFVIAREHRGRRLDLIHLDAYRLSGPEELETIGFDELRRRSDMVIAVEWPERIETALPVDRIDVAMTHAGPTERTIEVRAAESTISAFKGLLAQERCRMCGRPVPPGASTAPFCSERCRMADLGAWIV